MRKLAVAALILGLLAFAAPSGQARAGSTTGSTGQEPPVVPVKVEGEGYIRFVRDGRVVYAREGRLTIVKGRLASEHGYPILPATIVAETTTSLYIDAGGHVSAVVAGRSVPVGRINLALFDVPPAPAQDGFLTSSTRPRLLWPGSGGAGTIVKSEVHAYPSPGVSSGDSIPSDTLPVPRPLPNAGTPKPKPAGTSAASKPPVPSAGPVSKPEPGKGTITVRQVSEIEGPQFTLGDIAEIAAEPRLAERLAAVVAGDTPALGVDRVLEPARLAARLRMAGFEPMHFTLNVPTGAKVQRKGQRVSHQQLVEAAVSQVNGKLGESGTLVSKQPGPDMVLPLGELQMVCEGVMESEQGVRTTIAAYIDGKRVNARVIQLERLGVAPALKIGQTVKVRVRSAGAMIETTGRVSRSSKRGEPVEVLTSDGVTLSGTPTPEGVVEVTL